ncbi:hypothetical protein CCP3SC1AL1_3520002 [Gammaproteobacteria bacterium]
MSNAIAITNIIGLVFGTPVLIYYTYGSFVNKVKDVYEEYGNMFSYKEEPSEFIPTPTTALELTPEQEKINKTLYQRLFDRL